jgi:hypothetical protein
MIRSILLDRYALEDSLEIYFIFFEYHVIFYAFLNFLQFSEIINENQKWENRRTVVGWHFSPRPDTVGLAREPFWPVGAFSSIMHMHLQHHATCRFYAYPTKRKVCPLYKAYV